MSKTSITFWGAAGQVTGSCHLLEYRGRKILLDAGLFQGRRRASRELNQAMSFDPRSLDAIILSHAHIDHSGRLPLLASRQYGGPIHATPATRDLCAVMLADSAHIQESDFRWLQKKGRAGPEAEPLYTAADVLTVQELMHAHPYGKPFRIDGADIRATFTDAGHILGSASVVVQGERDGDPRIVFSGDIGRWNQPIIRDPQAPKGPVDTLIIESTYALRQHETTKGASETLGQIVRRVAERGGKVLIPSFALGRTQELVYALHELLRDGKIPEVPIFIDSPLALEATDVFRMHPEIFDRSEELVRETSNLLDHHMVRYVRSVEESKGLNRLRGPAIIIAASGMVESGRILHHLINHGNSPNNAIVFVGFQAEHTLGRRIREGRSPVKIYGAEHEIAAEITTINGYSAHADRDELRHWITDLGGPIRRAFCVHGEPEALEGMQAMLLELGVDEVHVPKHGETFTF
jgi:metallo-beta-lactamase family protein